MSANLIKAHGGSPSLLNAKGAIASSSMFVQDTTAGKSKFASGHMSGLVEDTMGDVGGRPVMSGVLTDTKQGVRDKEVPEIHKVSGKPKTQPKRMGQIPFSGPKF